jgi:hypothetical protein
MYLVRMKSEERPRAELNSEAEDVQNNTNIRTVLGKFSVVKRLGLVSSLGSSNYDTQLQALQQQGKLRVSQAATVILPLTADPYINIPDLPTDEYHHYVQTCAARNSGTHTYTFLRVTDHTLIIVTWSCAITPVPRASRFRQWLLRSFSTSPNDRPATLEFYIADMFNDTE